MTPQNFKRVKHLLNLADAAADFEFVDVKLVCHFHAMREELGLAKLLLIIEDYAKNKPTTKIPEVSQQNQIQTPLQ